MCAQAEEAVRKLEGEVEAARSKALGVEGALRGKIREMEALQRLLDQARVSVGVGVIVVPAAPTLPPPFQPLTPSPTTPAP